MADKRLEGLFNLLSSICEKLSLAILLGGVLAPYLEKREEKEAERLAFEKITTP